MKRAVVIGGAACVWDDLAAARKLGRFDAVIAINDAGAHYEGEIEIWATLHIEKMAQWVVARGDKGFPPARTIAGHKGHVREAQPNKLQPDYVTDYRWPGMSGSGSSGLFAVKVAIEHGFDRIVLCGVPMQAAGNHFFDARPWREVNSFTGAWPVALPYIKPFTRSMSGQTREWLGYPTKEWLESKD